MVDLVTLFGGGGFIGRYVAQELLRTGTRVRFAERDPRRAYYLKPLGSLGQTHFVSADVRNAEQVARAVEGADMVINLVGTLAGDFRGYHVDGARNVATMAAKGGARALVQMSALGADAGSDSAYGRSKGEGEAAVRELFPAATILRPSVVFGSEDMFINRFARMAQLMPVLPVIRGTARFQPVYVLDVARAVANAAFDPGKFGGRLFELGGPDVLTMEEINRFVQGAIRRHQPVVRVPDAVAGLLAALPGGPISRDQLRMLGRDNVVAAGADGLAAFAIRPTPLAAVAPQWLVRYRRGGRFGATAKSI